MSAEGLENLDNMGLPMGPINISDQAANQIRNMAALEGCTPEEVVRRGLMYLDNHLELVRQGWTGSYYELSEASNFERPDEPKALSILRRLVIGATINKIKCNFNFDNTSDPDTPST